MDLGDDTTTIHSSPQAMSSAELDAVKKGEARGKRQMEAEFPERFGLARQRGMTKKRSDKNYAQIDWADD